MIKYVICRKEIDKDISIDELLQLSYVMQKQVSTYPGDTISVECYTIFEQPNKKKYPVFVCERKVECIG